MILFSFIVDETARQWSKNGYFHSVQRLGISPRSVSQIADQSYIASKQHPAHNGRPNEDDM